MLLNEEFSYVCLDFETTGLDFQKDEPIQLGIVKMNEKGEILETFLSYIKPEKPIKELKNIVQFITKIAIEDLETAPSRNEVATQISHFFGKNTILIGHNIDFDFTFLKKLLPEVEIYGTFDTFQFAQALVPYAPSYALEILSSFLESKPLFLQWKSHFSLPYSSDAEKEQYHDAFFDTKSTLALFCYLCEYVKDLIEKYPVLERFLGRSETVLREIFGKEKEKIGIGILALPPLKKIAPTTTNLTFPSFFEKEPQNGEKFYLGNIAFKEFLLSLVSRKKSLLVFSSKPKLDIAKNLLIENGIKNIGFAKEEQAISEELFSQFLNKPSFNQSELYFLLKYCSHLYQGYGILDLNAKGDYLVYNFIKDSKKETKYPIVLTTHSGLYALLDKDFEKYQEYEIFFFDLEWRYRNYNQYLSRTCDLYYIQNFVDMLLYKYELLTQFGQMKEEDFQELKGFDAFFTMFLGVLRTETKKLFAGHDEDTISSDPIVIRPDFYQTRLMLPKFEEWKIILEKILEKSDFQLLWKQLEHFFSLCNTVVKIQIKLYQQSEFYFLFSEDTKFTNREEFKEIFGENKVYFLSHHEKQYTALKTTHPLQTVHYSFVTTLSALERMLKEDFSEGEKEFFIVSTVKEESKAIFEFLQKFDAGEKFELLVENITGGVGKNLYKAKKKFAKILVGGYNFLMMSYAQNISFDHLLIWNIKGPQSQLILDDIVRYAPTKQS